MSLNSPKNLQVSLNFFHDFLSLKLYSQIFQLPVMYAFLVHILSLAMGFVTMKIIIRNVSLMVEIVALMFEMSSVLPVPVTLVI